MRLRCHLAVLVITDTGDLRAGNILTKYLFFRRLLLFILGRRGYEESSKYAYWMFVGKHRKHEADVDMVLQAFSMYFLMQAEEEKTWQAAVEVKRFAAKKRSLGNIRFIGELFKLKVRPSKVTLC